MQLIPNFTPFFHMFDNWLRYIYQLDVVFGFIIVIIAGLIGLYSYKVHNFTKKRSYLLFSISFLFIALGYAVKMAFDLLINVEAVRNVLVYSAVSFPLVQKGFLLAYFVLVLSGYIIMNVIAMQGNRKTALLFLLLILLSLLLSQSYFLTFNFTVIILLLFLVYHFYMNFDRARTLNSGIVWYGFLLILISHIVMMFIVFSNKFYLLSNLMLVSGFALLLLNFMLVLRR